MVLVELVQVGAGSLRSYLARAAVACAAAAAAAAHGAGGGVVACGMCGWMGRGMSKARGVWCTQGVFRQNKKYI